MRSLQTNTPTRAEPVSVVQFRRRARSGAYSLESVFDSILPYLPPEVSVTVVVLPDVSVGATRRLRSMLHARRRRGEVNHVTGDINYLALGLPRRSTILTVLDTRAGDDLRGARALTLRLLWLILPGRAAGTVVAISEFVRAELLRATGLRRKQISVIYPSVDERFFRSRSELPAEPRVLFVGTAHNKNLTAGIEALSNLDCEITVIGRLNQEQRELLEAHGRPFRNRYDLTRSDIIFEYQRTRILCFPSLYEGFGLPIAEANAIGRPVVTANSGAMAEVAADAAFLIDVHQHEQIQSAVARLLQDDSAAHGLVEAGFLNAERFHPRTAAAQWARAYAVAALR